MHLSKRLETIAKLVEPGKTVFDIGCDHAYLSIYLTLYNDNNLIATDINKLVIESANKNIKRYNLENKINLIHTDGLKNLNIKADDIIIISGMGTKTIKQILSNGNLSDTLIISSNNCLTQLREFIYHLNYIIIDEKFIIDQGKEYVIIKFKKGQIEYKDEDFIIGPILKNNLDYLNYMEKKYNRLCHMLPENLKATSEYYKIYLLVTKNLNKL